MKHPYIFLCLIAYVGSQVPRVLVALSPHNLELTWGHHLMGALVFAGIAACWVL